MSVGRNDPCPCGSGKKYKQCHGGAPAATRTEIGPETLLLKQALQSMERGDHRRVQTLCRQVLDINPEQAEARHYLGMALCAGGDLDAGIPHLRASLALRPMEPVAHNLAVFHNNLALWLEKTGNLDDAEVHYKQALNSMPDYRQACFNLVKLLMRRQKENFAKPLLEYLLKADPQNPELRGRMAEALFATKEFTAMEKAYRALIAGAPQPAPLHSNLGANLRMIGRYADARQEYEQVLKLDPENLDAILNIAQIEEQRNQLDESERWTERGLAQKPGDPALCHNMARLRRRQGQLDEALEWLDRAAASALPPSAASEVARERGMVLDKQKQTEAAFAAFREANDLQRADLEQRTGRVFYDKARHQKATAAAMAYFTHERLTSLRPYLPTAPMPSPVFIVGFPRSGTTLVEQMLGVHPNLHAGDELHGLPELRAYAASQQLGSWKPYPECLDEAAEPGKHDALHKLRDYYMHIAREMGALDDDKPRFTDKMPLNETLLGLVRLLFPASPVIHVVRHPLDIILSCYFNQLSHGDNCALALDTLAFHYIETWKLVEHYLAEMDLRYTRVRYEDLLEDPEREMRRLFEFLGEEWEPRCLEFHKTKRVARTASYAQVNQPLYRSSQERWRPYRKHLEPIITELKPLIEKLGYSVD